MRDSFARLGPEISSSRRLDTYLSPWDRGCKQVVALKMLNKQGKESTRNLLKLWRQVARTLKSARNKVDPVYKKKILLFQSSVLLSWRDVIIEKKANMQEDRVLNLSSKIEVLQQQVGELEGEVWRTS